jgi:hypothetical protein
MKKTGMRRLRLAAPLRQLGPNSGRVAVEVTAGIAILVARSGNRRFIVGFSCLSALCPSFARLKQFPIQSLYSTGLFVVAQASGHGLVDIDR